MNRIVYGSIAAVGMVFALLELLVRDNLISALSIIMIDIYFIGFLFLFKEYRYYRQHNALLASFQFLIVPVLLLFVGNYFGPRGFGQNFFSFSLGLLGGIEAFSSLLSIILILPVIMVLQLTARYYDGRYPGFVIRRRQFGPKFLPLTIHLAVNAGLIAMSLFIGVIDVFVLGFVLASIIQLVQKFIVPLFRSSRDTSSDRDRRSFLDSVLGRSDSRRRNRVSPSSRSDLSNSSRSSARTASRNRSRRRREIPTSPSNGYREIPTTSRNSSRTASSRSSRSSNRSRSTQPAPSRRVAEVDRGVDMVSASKTRKVKSAKLSNYLPKGNYDMTDLKCMVCYEDFRNNSRKNIVICPKCKFPAHEVEFKSWLKTSSRCPRCNKEVSNNRQLNNGLVSESQYAKFIRKL